MREAAVAFFGAFPATVLCMPLLGVMLTSIGDLVGEGKRSALMLVAVCVCGLAGTVALFLSIRSKPGPLTMIGLALGIVAAGSAGGLSFSGGIWRWLFLAPAITAVALIVEGLFAKEDDVDEFYG